MPRKIKQSVSTDDVTTSPAPTALDRDPISAIVEKVDRRERAFGSAQWRIDELKPNVHNERLFPDSLAAESIELLAEDLEARGMEVPIRIMPDGTVVNGERRLRAAKHLGWTVVDVVVGPQLTDTELLDRVISDCASARQMTLREQANIYRAVSNQYKRSEGRAPGRPQAKPSPNGEGFLSPKQIARIAAAKARFDSVSIAERTVAIFSRGSEALQEQVARREVSITAAFDQLPKRPRRPKLTAAEQCVDLAANAGLTLPAGAPESVESDVDRRLLESGVQASDEASVLALPSGEQTPDGVPGRTSQGATGSASAEGESCGRSDVLGASTNPLPRLYEGELLDEPRRDPMDGSGEDAPSSDSSVALEDDVGMTIDQVLERVYEHLGSLAEEDGRAAKGFVGRVVRRMKEILELHA